jgi:hypothetical protein
MNSKRKLALGAALTVALALGGAAVAAAAGNGNGNGKKEKAKTAKTLRPSTNASALFGHFVGFGMGANLAAVTSYLGISAATLASDLRSGKTLAQIADSTPNKSAAGLIQTLVTDAQTKLAAAVSAGKLTQSQSDAISTNLTQAITNIVNGTFPAGLRPGGFSPGPGFGRGFGPGALLSTAATYLGISAATLKTDLQSGKTLAQIADSTPNKSAAGLIQALVADQQADLAKAVTAGKLTQAQSDALSANLTQRVTALVNGMPPARAYGGHGGWHGAPPTPGGSNA